MTDRISLVLIHEGTDVEVGGICWMSSTIIKVHFRRETAHPSQGAPGSVKQYVREASRKPNRPLVEESPRQVGIPASPSITRLPVGLIPMAAVLAGESKTITSLLKLSVACPVNGLSPTYEVHRYSTSCSSSSSSSK